MRTKHGSNHRRIGIGEASERLGVHPDTLRRWEDAGRIASIRTIGNQRRYLVSDVEALAAGETLPVNDAASTVRDRKAAS